MLRTPRRRVSEGERTLLKMAKEKVLLTNHCTGSTCRFSITGECECVDTYGFRGDILVCMEYVCGVCDVCGV